VRRSDDLWLLSLSAVGRIVHDRGGTFLRVSESTSMKRKIPTLQASYLISPARGFWLG